MRNPLARIGQWLAALGVAVFAANIFGFFVLLGRGSTNKNPQTDQVIALHSHGTIVFVTHFQYGAWIGSLILAAVLFITGSGLFEASRRVARHRG